MQGEGHPARSQLVVGVSDSQFNTLVSRALDCGAPHLYEVPKGGRDHSGRQQGDCGEGKLQVRPSKRCFQAPQLVSEPDS